MFAFIGDTLKIRQKANTRGRKRTLSAQSEHPRQQFSEFVCGGECWWWTVSRKLRSDYEKVLFSKKNKKNRKKKKTSYAHTVNTMPSVNVWLCLSDEVTPFSAHEEKLDSGNRARAMIQNRLCAHMVNLKLHQFNTPDNQDATLFALSLMPSRCSPYYGGHGLTPGGDMPWPKNFKKMGFKSFKGLLVLTFASMAQYELFEIYTEMNDNDTYETMLTLFDHSTARFV